MLPAIDLGQYIADFAMSPLARWRDLPPWVLTNRSSELVRQLLAELSPEAYRLQDDIAVHHCATIETGAVLKGPLIVGAHCFVAAGAYLRGGCWLAEHCTIGPGAELKSSFVFAGTKLAHFNFVGDSVLGRDVNLEAGSIICNHRNERTEKQIRVRLGSTLYPTGCDKFGALLGDACRLGANAVVAPGAMLVPGTVVPRTELCDQDAVTFGKPG